MIDFKILLRAFIVGSVLQIVMVVLGHFIPWVVLHVFVFGGMMISATAAYLYAMHAGKGFFPGATAGAIVGGGCALIGITASVLLGETERIVIPFGTAICVLTGAVGGLFGQMAARLRALDDWRR